MSDHDNFREWIEPYALGALDSDERAALETHLRAGCAECSKALDEARWLVSQLAHLAPDAAPSGILRGRLLRQVHAEARTTPAATLTARSRIPIWMWGAVAAAILFAFYNVWNARQIQEAIKRTNASAAAALAKQQELQQQLALAKREAVILTDPKSKKIMLPASHEGMPELEAMWHEKMGLVVMGHKLPMPSGNRTLQLWLIPKGSNAKPMPSMMLRPDAEGNFMLMVTNPPWDMHETAALAITEEPAGGSLQPTSAPMWRGSVS